MKLRDSNKIDLVIILVLFALASILILSNLGNIYMWGDEAQTALVSKTILTHGIPLGTDGLNYFSVEQGAEYGANYTWRWHPWLPFYVLAVFFKLFGFSTFVARLPFALFGIATVLLCYLFGKALWNSRRAGVLAALALATSVPMILLVRQCRYYSATTFFVVAAMYAYWEMRRGKKYAPTAFAVSMFCLFHSFYIYLPALIIAVVVHAILCSGGKGDSSTDLPKRCLRQVILISAVVVLVNIPWMVYFSSAMHGPRMESSLLSRVSELVPFLITQVFKHMIPPWLLVLPILAAVLKWRRRQPVTIRGNQVTSRIVMLLTFALVTIGTVAFTAPGCFLRYLAPVIPLFCLIIGLMLDEAMKIHRGIGVLVLVLLAVSGNMRDYLYEMTHDYDGPVEGIVLHLKAHAQPGDVVAANSEALPLMFYTDLRVITGASGEDISSAGTAEWIVLRQYVTDSERELTDIILSAARNGEYEAITLDYPDIESENRENPEDHNFRTVEGVAGVLIGHRLPRL